MNHLPLIQYMQKQNGYVSTKKVLSEGIHFNSIKKLLEKGQIEQIKRGLYRFKNKNHIPFDDFIGINQAIPKAVICLYSALSHYNLTTFMPTEVMLAIPKGYHAPKLIYPPIRVFHFSEKQYEAGIETIKTKNGNYKIYSPEKSICDVFRFRWKLGDDTAKEALFTYLEKPDKNLAKLLEYAKICRMTQVITPYIEARMG